MQETPIAEVLGKDYPEHLLLRVQKGVLQRQDSEPLFLPPMVDTGAQIIEHYVDAPEIVKNVEVYLLRRTGKDYTAEEVHHLFSALAKECEQLNSRFEIVYATARLMEATMDKNPKLVDDLVAMGETLAIKEAARPSWRRSLLHPGENTTPQTSPLPGRR